MQKTHITQLIYLFVRLFVFICNQFWTQLKHIWDKHKWKIQASMEQQREREKLKRLKGYVNRLMPCWFGYDGHIFLLLFIHSKRLHFGIGHFQFYFCMGFLHFYSQYCGNTVQCFIMELFIGRFSPLTKSNKIFSCIRCIFKQHPMIKNKNERKNGIKIFMLRRLLCYLKKSWTIWCLSDVI